MKNKNKKRFIRKVQISIQQEKGMRFWNMLLKSFSIFNDKQLKNSGSLTDDVLNLMEDKRGILAEKYKRKHKMMDFMWFERSLGYAMNFLKHNKTRKKC